MQRARSSSFDSLFDSSDDIVNDDDRVIRPADGAPSFDPPSVGSQLEKVESILPAVRHAPPSVPGLFVLPSVFGPDDCSTLWDAIVDHDVFCGGAKDQVMIFSSPSRLDHFPPFVADLIRRLPGLLEGKVGKDVWDLLFVENEKLAWQVICNLYKPGQGISPHVDLETRFADGIVGVSLGGGTVMEFEEVREGARAKEAVWLEEGSIIVRPLSYFFVSIADGVKQVLSGPSRWSFTHGIPCRLLDLVREDTGEVRTVRRTRTRVSLTLRRMKEGAEVVGG